MFLYYKDRTFCTNIACKQECDRRLTKEIQQQARKAGMPVSMACFKCNMKEVNNG